MDSKIAYSSKAGKYARCRWDYAPGAIGAVFELARLSAGSRIADIGAGTGILTRHFAGRVGHVFAVEPNREMRQMLERELGAEASCSITAGSAEDTGLPCRTAAQT
jgi:16S rRNA A1518/A1519 N6-dimethyltransferase RsmA/KsgA/DIM1 with predicted DNA glycosylase/AP lyase activity